MEWLIAGVTAVCLALSLSYHMVGMTRPGTAQVVAALGLLTILFVWPVHLLLFRFALPALATYPPRVTMGVLLAALMAAMLMSVAIPMSELPWQIPEHSWGTLGYRGVTVLLADILSMGTVLFVAASWILGRQPGPVKRAPRERWSWLRLAIPGILVWTIYWVAYYPALMSPDSLDQWAQAIGRYSLYDPQPVFYTLMLRIVSWAWQSPAAVALLQILLTALLIGYGLTVLREAGVSRRITALLSILAALAPFNATMVNTIWRDIPYSICILALTILLMKAVLDPALEYRLRYWIWLGILCALVALLRYNGPYVAIGLLAMNLLYRKLGFPPALRGRFQPYSWRYPALATCVFFALYLFTQGPLYDSLHVIRFKWSPTPIWLHAIGAHVASGTPLVPEEALLLNSLSPLDQKWHYSETSSALMLSPEWFDYKVLESNADKIFPLFIALTLRNPIVTIKHIYWSSMLVWVISQPPKGWLGATPVQGDLIPPNDLGLRTSSLFPALTDRLTQFVGMTLANFIFLWRPAIYVYLGLAALAVGAVRSQNPVWLNVGTPVAVQSLLMLVGSINAEERYMYPVQLSFFLLAGIAFLPRARTAQTG